jgi:peptidyl-prolyl cis-trans isomerase B (cyclophilin B)
MSRACPGIASLKASAWLLLVGTAPPSAGQTRPEIDLTQQAVVRTSEGTFVLTFHSGKAPRHVRLFLALAAEGAYDGTLFHRVVRWGIVQGGDPLSRNPARRAAWGTGGLGKLKSEVSDLKHVRGTVSTVEAPGKPDSGGNQFFICVTPQPQLDGKFSAFGTVAEGIEVVDRISEAPADAAGVPLRPPVIEKVTLRPARPDPPPAFSDASAEELARTRATLETSLGSFTIGFLPELAPEHARNFLRLAQAGFYDGTGIHRVVRDFVLQGGDLATRVPPLPDFRRQDLVRRLKPEFNETRHVKGVVSMARGEAPDSAETSFFVCLGDASGLDREYTAFGRVVEGLEVLDRFQQVEVDGETPRQRIDLRRVVVKRLP